MKQVDAILADVNVDTSKIKLVKCVQAINEAGWIEANLANCYDEFDKIRIVEGAVKGRPNSTPDGHSTDNTRELIRNFPDPSNKIEFYSYNRHFDSLEQLKQVFLDIAKEGEWLFIVDVDEFYMEGDINRIRKFIMNRPNSANEFIPIFLHFYRDFKHLKAPHPEWQPQHQRIIKYTNGLRYHTHPVATLPDGRCTYFDASIQSHRFTIPVYIFHYGHAKGKEEHKAKAEFYRSELQKFEGRGGSAASEFDIKLDEFVNYKEDLSTILEYDGPHPVALQNHPLRNYNEPFYEDKQLVNWKKDKVYSKDRQPNIIVWMEDYWGTKRMNPFYNEAE